MATSEAAKLAARIKKQSKVATEDVKDVEARAGSRDLPGGIKDGVDLITKASLGENRNDQPYFMLHAQVLEPEECDDVKCRGINHTYYFALSATRSEDGKWSSSEKENVEECISKLKLIGFEEEFEDIEHWMDGVLACMSWINDEENDLFIKFSTSRRPSKNGEYRAQLQGVCDEDYEPPEFDRENEHSEDGYEEDDAAPFDEGDVVVSHPDYFEDGESYTGTVTGVDADNEVCTVEFDDETTDVPWDQLELEDAGAGEEEAEEEGGYDPQVGDAVISTGDYFEDGNDYEGVVDEVYDDDTVDVTFDGESETTNLPAANIVPN